MIVFEMHALAMGKWSLYKSGKGSCLRRAEELGRFPAYLARFYLLTGGGGLKVCSPYSNAFGYTLGFM